MANSGGGENVNVNSGFGGGSGSPSLKEEELLQQIQQLQSQLQILRQSNPRTTTSASSPAFDPTKSPPPFVLNHTTSVDISQQLPPLHPGSEQHPITNSPNSGRIIIVSPRLPLIMYHSNTTGTTHIAPRSAASGSPLLGAMEGNWLHPQNTVFIGYPDSDFNADPYTSNHSNFSFTLINSNSKSQQPSSALHSPVISAVNNSVTVNVPLGDSTSGSIPVTLSKTSALNLSSVGPGLEPGLTSSLQSRSFLSQQAPIEHPPIGSSGLGSSGGVGQQFSGELVSVSDEHELRELLLERCKCYPVFLSDELAHLTHSRYVGGMLWPLFHYVLPTVSFTGSGAVTDRGHDQLAWQAYVATNHKYAEAVIEVFQRGDVIWIDGLELMLLPSLLRKRVRDIVTIGYYLGTPFPSSEFFRVLPARNELLEGMLAADLIGFHTHDYAKHFRSSCTRLMGFDSSFRGVFCNATKFSNSGSSMGHLARVGSFPMGIDADKVLNTIDSEFVRALIQSRRARFAGKRVLLAVDRMNHIKGVPHKILAFEQFLKNYPRWKQTAVLVLIVVEDNNNNASSHSPLGYMGTVGSGNTNYSDDQAGLRMQVQRLVGRVNGRFGAVDHAPVVFVTQKMSFEELCALYVVADAAVVTSLRDSMSKVSAEYVVSQRDHHGVLILSEFAGSPHLLSGAVRVNPWNTEQLADAMDEALSMPLPQRRRNHARLFRYLTTHTAEYWTRSFAKELLKVDAELLEQRLSRDGPSVPQLSVKNDLSSFLSLPPTKSRASKANDSSRLWLFEYEGVLNAPQSLPELAWPSDELVATLGKLASDERNMIFVISSRSSTVLDAWFPNHALGAIAELGFEVRMPGSSRWTPLVHVSSAELSWREDVLPNLRYFTERTPGSYVEEKNSILSWYYRDSDPQFGSWQAMELRADLNESGFDKVPVDVVDVHKCVEIRSNSVSKVRAVHELLMNLSESKPEFIFVLCGNESSDEELYAFLHSISIKDAE